MHAAGRVVDPDLVAAAESFTIDEGERCATLLLERGAAPTAIIAANDMLALGCYSALERAGLRCPDDVSVVGFNDMPFIDRLSPPLTTVRIPHYDLGAQAAQLLVDQLHQPDEPMKVVLLVPSLVVRGSTAPAKAPLQIG
jgi:LacI family transcriptional regulator